MDDFEKAERIWENISYPGSQVDVDDELIERLLTKIQLFQNISSPAPQVGKLIAGAIRVLRTAAFDIAPSGL